MSYTYCPRCATALTPQVHGGQERAACPACGWVHWNNPVPVVAAIVQRGEDVVLVRSHGWPETWYGLVTGFLEAGEEVEAAVLREVKEETGLDGRLGEFIGAYSFFRRNQLILAWHVEVPADGAIQLDTSELADYRCVPITEVEPWPAGTGHALREWLRRRGIERDYRPFPPAG